MTKGLRKLRTFMKHLWEECHDGGDFERTSDARRLDELLAALAEAGRQEGAQSQKQPEAANQVLIALTVLREQGYLGVSVAEALQIVRLCSPASEPPVCLFWTTGGPQCGRCYKCRH